MEVEQANEENGWIVLASYLVLTYVATIGGERWSRA